MAEATNRAPLDDRSRSASLAAERPLLELRAATRDFGGGRGIRDVTLALEPGQVVAVIGANGSGKTTLLRCAALFESLDAGTVTIAGQAFTASNGGRVAVGREASGIRGRVLGAVFQDSAPWPHLTVLQNVVMPLQRGLGLSHADATSRAKATLETAGLSDRLDSRPSHLSGGLRQRLVLARSVALDPAVLLADETTSALDPEWTERVRALLRDFASRGGAALVISHQMGFVKRVADSVHFLHLGRVLEQGRPDRTLTAPKTPELAEFLANA
jgi:polar amino acid transport system ATP-binding protein